MENKYIILFIIGNNGNMIYYKNFDTKAMFNTNDCLQIASTLFTINDLTSLIIPEKLKKKENFGFENTIKYKLDYIFCDKFYINYYNTLTNMKIILVSKYYSEDYKKILKNIYEAYSRIVIKDISYSIGQPIKNKNFEELIMKFFKKS